MISRVRLVGSPTQDKTERGWEIGGSVTYSAAVYRLCNVDHVGEDGGGSAAPRFNNRYTTDGHRVQEVIHRGDVLELDDWIPGECVHAMPVLGEVRLAPQFLAQKPRDAVLVVNAQGWLRDAEVKETWAEVRRKPWAIPAGLDALFFSNEDVSDPGSFILEARAIVPLVIKTEGPNGARIWSPDGAFRVSARQMDAVDPTGAGDVFAAAFVAQHLVHGETIERSCQFATACAGEVVRGSGLQALERMTREDLERLADEVPVERL